MGRRKVDTKSAFDVIADQRVSINIGGVDHTLTPAEALEQKIFNDAMGFNLRAIRRVLEWIRARDALRCTKPSRLPQILIENVRPANVDDAIIILGIASHNAMKVREDGKRFLELEPWVADLCYKRERLRSSEDIAELKGSTRRVVENGWDTSC